MPSSMMYIQIIHSRGLLLQLRSMELRQWFANLTNTTSRINYLQTSGFPSMSGFTFSAWIRPGQIAASDNSATPLAWMIANLSNGTGNGAIDIWLQNDGKIYALLGDDLYHCIRTTSVLVLNTWYHIVFTFDGNLRKRVFIFERRIKYRYNWRRS